jgi:hypothetical protein
LKEDETMVVSKEIVEEGLHQLEEYQRYFRPEASDLLNKLKAKSNEIYNAVKDYDINKSELEITTNRERLLKEAVAHWKGLVTFMDNFDTIAQIAGITNEKDKDRLWDFLFDSFMQLSDETMPALYAQVKAVREYGYEAHNITLKDVSLFLVPLVTYILLERR